MKALIVKEDGLIYAAEVPKEPNITDYGDDEYLYPLAHYTYDMEDYEAALASAKESALLVSDQEKATKLVLKAWRKSIGEWVPEKFLPVGVYSIPDLQWRKEERPCEDSGTDDQGRKVDFEWVAVIK